MYKGQTMRARVLDRAMLNPKLSPSARILYYQLDSTAGPEAVIIRHQESLADDLQIRSRQIRNLIIELRDAGLIEVTRGRGRGSEFTLLWRGAE